jgi:hypothetical protein
MWHRVDLVWTEVSEERITSIPEDPILHSYRREDLKSYDSLLVLKVSEFSTSSATASLISFNFSRQNQIRL